MSVAVCLMVRNKKGVEHVCGKTRGHRDWHECGQTHLVNGVMKACKEKW